MRKQGWRREGAAVAAACGKRGGRRRSSHSRSMRKNAEKDWKEQPESATCGKRRAETKGRNNGGTTAGTAGAVNSNSKNRTADAKPGGRVEVTRTGEKQRQYRKTKQRLKKRGRTQEGLERPQRNEGGRRTVARQTPESTEKKKKKTGENRGDDDQEIAQEKKIANKARKTLQENHQEEERQRRRKEQEENEKVRCIA